MTLRVVVCFLFLANLFGGVASSFAEERFITLASTTSTENSGLFDHLLPAFTAESDINVRVVAVGTGKAIKMAQSGDADVLLVHHRASEEKFVTEGYGVERLDVMYNDFVIVGPKEDPAKIGSMTEVGPAMAAIAKTANVFTSRGDDSGTHKKEISLWELAGVNSTMRNQTWYRETGTGMGATLNVASGIGGYALTDRATWLKFANKGELVILLQGDSLLFNQYGVIAVNPAKHPHVKTTDSQTFIQWLVSEQGQKLVNAYQIAGQQGFFANAGQ